MINAGPFLAGPHYRLTPIVWGEDQHGVFWSAYLHDKATDTLLGRVGTYQVIENGKREEKAVQIADLKSWGIYVETSADAAKEEAASVQEPTAAALANGGDGRGEPDGVAGGASSPGSD